MEEVAQVEQKAKRGWLRTAVFAIAGLFFLIDYLQTRQTGSLLSTIGFAMILPNTFLHPVNWRKPTTSVGKPHFALTLLSLAGTICIVSGLFMQWK